MQGGCVETKGKAPVQTCKVDSTISMCALKKGLLLHMKATWCGSCKRASPSRFHSVAQAIQKGFSLPVLCFLQALQKGLHLFQLLSSAEAL